MILSKPGDTWWVDASSETEKPGNYSAPKIQFFEKISEIFRDFGPSISMMPLMTPVGFSGPVALAMAPPLAPPLPPSSPTSRPVQLYQPVADSFAELIFPGFDGDSFIWKISLFQIGEFLFTVAAGNDHGSPSTCTLYNFGASWGPAIASGQLWRLILPMTLHANMMHLFFNIFFQLRIGFGMEKQFGWKKFIKLYTACGILGNLISVAVDPFKLAVGASTAGFGLIGVWLAEIALSWHVMGPNRDRTLVWIAFMASAMIMMSTSGSNVDLFGHVGGSLAGFLMAVSMSDMPEQYKPLWYDSFKKNCKFALAGLVVGCGAKIMLTTPHYPLPNCGLGMLGYIARSGRF